MEQSAGLTLAYDLTEISPGRKKGAVLRRGHLLTEDDLEILRDIGKSNVKILELDADEVHEDDAAEQLAGFFKGPGVQIAMPGEAWADLIAQRDGLLKVDSARALQLNLVDGVLLVTRHTNSPVRAGDLIGRTKVRDLATTEGILDAAEKIAQGPNSVVEVLPFRCMRAAAIITGREVFEGRKRDAFEPLLRQRVEAYGSALSCVRVVRDELDEVARAIDWALGQGVDMVFVTGGGSPDDCTSASIKLVADEIAFHGAPFAPGAMTILAYAHDTPILGVPGGLLARPRGFFDVVLPRLLAGERPTREEVAGQGHGGLCLRCETCHFPACSFGK